MIIEENIKKYEHSNSNYETCEMQAAAVNISIKSKKYTVAALYCPRRHALKKEDYFRLFRTLGENFIIGSDFNTKHTFWASRLTTTKDKQLFDAIKQAKCTCHSTRKPTYWPADGSKIPDLIDFFILKNISYNKNGEWARKNNEKAELFAEHLANTFEAHPADCNETDRVIDPITTNEIAREIRKNLSAKQPPGYDLINSQVLKELPKRP